MINRFAIPSAPAATLLTLLAAPAAWAAYESPYGGGHMWGGGWGGMIFGPLMMIALLAVVVWVAFMIARWLTASRRDMTPPAPTPTTTALHILEERYARGEIDREEFEERRRVLKGENLKG